MEATTSPFTTSLTLSSLSVTMAIDFTFLFIVFSLILSFFFILNKKTNGSNTPNLPPGPPKLPIIGNIHQITGALPHHSFRHLAKKYGPIMHLQLGQISTIVVSSPRLAKDVFKTNDLALASRPSSVFGDIVLYGSTDVALGPYGDYWRQLKKIITVELLSNKKVRSFSSFRQQEVDSFTQFIRSACGKPVTLREKVTEMINNIVCKSSFGEHCKQQDVLIELVDELGILVSGFYVADLFPEFGFLSVISGMKSKLNTIHKSLDKIFDEIFEDRKSRKSLKGESDNDLLDVLFTIKESGGLQFPITDDNIKAVFVNMFTGGTDTSAMTIEWAMSEMMKNPNVMEKAQKEVRETFKGKKTIVEADLEDLVYLKLIIKETLRLHPPLPLLLPRECIEQCQIDGYDIPLKTKVIVNAFACAVDPEYWDDAESFKPERFDKSSVDFMGTNFEFVPFGAGRRMCPGITFGLISIEFALAQMLYYFNWQLPSGLSPKDVDMTENDGATATKKVPLSVMPTLNSSI
ncbi:costunolide synthase-like [Cynara cardunculus var. scolymus]|uniref:Cytochrome P450 n=1 Tax=Cynara cardunculus var. scolymus TaxID=59895 RepID=A0A124SB26_CYNCS|nr:costunolide synthase-like [Cynara cardunculus var. scolymus]KVH89317.1 hypothetical protein Ccrd_008697 [Cynara cardunculus var. scolymus]